jgi:hypothetical protein
VPTFATEREALDFLAATIAAEAKRENVPLSEVERKMLYFSETEWTLPDMAKVSAEFDRKYDQDEYEQKIAGLIRGLTGQFKSKEESDAWDAAVGGLGDRDRYFQVLLGLSHKKSAGHPEAHGFLPTLDRPVVRPPHDTLKLWVTAFAIVLSVIGLAVVRNHFPDSRFSKVVDWFFSDRNHFSLLVLIALALWFLWHIRDDLKIIGRGLLKRP